MRYREPKMPFGTQISSSKSRLLDLAGPEYFQYRFKRWADPNS